MMEVIHENSGLVLTLAVMTLVGYGFSAAGWAGPDKGKLRSGVVVNLLECLWWGGLACSIVAMLVTIAAAAFIAWCALWVIIACLCLAPFMLIFGGLRAAGGLVAAPIRIVFALGGAVLMPLGLLWAVTTVRSR